MIDFFVLSCAKSNNGTRHIGYFLPKVEVQDHGIMIYSRNSFDQPVKNNVRTYGNIRKFGAGLGDDCTAGCLLDCLYFKENYKLNAIERKQQAPGADPKSIQQINFTRYIERDQANDVLVEEMKEVL